MNFPNSNGIPPLKSCESGVALVLTLLIVSMLVVVVVGFVSVSRLEQIAARNATYQSAAEQMAQLATSQAVAQLRQAVQAGLDAGGYATQSGRLHPIGGDSQPLFSQGGGNTNINAMTSYGWVTGTANENISVGLVNAPSVAGQVPGRTGFYIADETAKLPINFASPGRSALNPVPPRPFSIKGVDTNLQSDAVTSFSKILSGTITNNNTISNWSYFFTPEQVALAISNIGPVRSRRVTVATATNQLAPFAKPKTPWGTDRILLNQVALSSASVADLTNVLTDAKLTNIFGSHFGDKYGEAGLQQLAANLIQLRSDHWEPTRMFIGTNPIVGTVTNAAAAPAPTSGDLKKTNGIPQSFFGYVPFPMIKEVAVYYSYGWVNAGIMTVRVFVDCTLYNPYPVAFGGGGGVFAQIDKAFFTVSYSNPDLNVDFEARRRGPEGTPNSETDFPYNFSGADAMDAWGIGAGRYDSLSPASGIQVVDIPTIPAGGERTVVVPFDLNFLETDPSAIADTLSSFSSRFIFDQIKLLADKTKPESVRDWISGYDFFNALSDGASAAEFTVGPPPGGPEGTADGGGARLLADFAVPSETKLVKRFDPRLRLPLDAATPFQVDWPGKIWFKVAYQESVVYVPKVSPNPAIPADPGFAGDPARAVYNPDIPPRLAFSSSSNNEDDETPVLVWSMPADLGKVFTGVPWRSLRMQPQPAEEGDAIPDWVLLDMVDFTDGTKALTMVNPNSGYASAGAPVPGFGAGLRSQLDVLTNATARTNVANPLVPTETAPNPATFPAATAANIANLVTQAATPQWSGAWGGRREALGFPPSAIMLPSEIVEVAGFADYAGVGDNFKLNEYWIGSLFPGLSTKSRFFKIYAVGEAFQGTNQQVAATALLQTLVEVNDSTTPPTVTTIYQYPPAD